MSQVQSLKKQLATVAANYKTEIIAARKFYEDAADAEEEADVLAEELSDLRSLDISTKAGKQIIAAAKDKFTAAITTAKTKAKQLAAKGRQAENEADDQYGLGERIYGQISQYDDGYRFPAAFDETV